MALIVLDPLLQLILVAVESVRVALGIGTHKLGWDVAQWSVKFPSEWGDKVRWWIGYVMSEGWMGSATNDVVNEATAVECHSTDKLYEMRCEWCMVLHWPDFWCPQVGNCRQLRVNLKMIEKEKEVKKVSRRETRMRGVEVKYDRVELCPVLSCPVLRTNVD